MINGFARLVIVCMLCSNTLGAQNGSTKRFLDLVYNLEFNRADSLLSVIDDTHISKNFLRINYLWWKSLTEEFTEWDEFCFDSIINQELEVYSQIPRKGNTQRFLELSLVAFKIRYDVAHGHYFRSLRLMYSYTEELEYILQSDYQNEFLLIKGVYNTAMGYLRRTSFFTKSMLWFLPQADEIKGLEQLRASERLNLETTGIESQYFLFKIYKALYKEEKKAQYFLQKLSTRYPENYIFESETTD